MKYEASSSNPSAEALSIAACDLFESDELRNAEPNITDQNMAAIMRRLANQKCDAMGWAGHEDVLFMLLAFTSGTAYMMGSIEDVGLVGQLAVHAARAGASREDQADKARRN